MPVITPATRLVDLIGPKSWTLFSRLSDTDWLKKSSKTWPNEPGFQEVFYQVRHLKVVNDVAERGVKLATDYATSLTHNEDQRQYLYQVVEEQRKQ